MWQCALISKFRRTVHLPVLRSVKPVGIQLFGILIFSSFVLIIYLIIHKPNIIKEERPLLTIFTTFTEPSNSIELRDRYIQQVLLNWASFPDIIRPVLFVDADDDRYLAETAVKFNWTVLPCVKRDKFGHMIYKEMYRVVFRNYNSILYGYASQDLLFDGSIVSTLKGIFNSLHQLEYNVLLTAKRNESQKTEYIGSEHSSQVTLNRSTTKSLDTFPFMFFTRKGCWMNWLSLPDTIVFNGARLQYASAIIAQAFHDGVNVIDSAETLFLEHTVAFNQITSKNLMGDSVKDEQFNFDKEVRLKTVTGFDSEVHVSYK